MRWLLLIGLMMGCKKPEPPRVAPRPVVKINPLEDAKRFHASLKRGQKLEASGDHAGASAAFREALEVFPEHPQALDELGVSAFHAHDLASAEAFAARAVKASREPAQRGRALYNLGRVQEARGEKDAAAESYRRSLEARPNQVVQKKLAALDPKAAPTDPVAPRLMAGPFATLEAWCQQSDVHGECVPDEDSHPTFSCSPGKKLDWLGGAQIVDASCAHNDNHDIVTDEIALAVRIGSSFYVGDLGATLNSYRQTESLEIDKLEARPLSTGAAVRLVISATRSNMYKGMDATTTGQIFIAGVGAGQKPSLTGPILSSYSADEDDPETGDNKGHHGGLLTVEFLPGEVLAISGPTHIEGSGLDPASMEGLLGKHPLIFR